MHIDKASYITHSMILVDTMCDETTRKRDVILSVCEAPIPCFMYDDIITINFNEL